MNFFEQASDRLRSLAGALLFTGAIRCGCAFSETRSAAPRPRRSEACADANSVQACASHTLNRAPVQLTIVRMHAVARGRAQTSGEEIANALSHGIGFVFALAALPVLVHGAAARGTGADVVGAGLFAGTMIVLYLVSTLYHAMPAGRAKVWLNRLDHASIYLFIAGSYMPFLLGVLRGAWGWSLFGVVWGAAALGIVAKLLDRLRHPLWSTGLYVAMGWVALIAAAPLVERMSTSGLAWLVAGGLSYTAGAVVFLFDSKLRYAHFAWHLFVMGGSACHVCAVLWHATA